MRYILFVLMSALFIQPVARAGESAPPTNTAALVNGAVITTADFRAELDRVLRLRNKSETGMEPAMLAMVKKEALDTLIGRELLYQESRRNGISIPPAAVDNEVGRLRRHYASDGDYRAALAKLGLNDDMIKSQVERGMAIQSFIESKFGSKTTVTDDEARSYYDSHQDSFRQAGQAGEGRSKAVLPFQAVRDRISKQMQRERTLDELNPYLRQLRDAARVEIYLVGDPD